MTSADTPSRDELKWSCDERNRKQCRNAHGCHCREITDLLHRLAAKPSADPADPADVWDAYCDEVPAKRRSPQGALAFGYVAATTATDEVREAAIKLVTPFKEIADRFPFSPFVTASVNLQAVRELWKALSPGEQKP